MVGDNLVYSAQVNWTKPSTERNDTSQVLSPISRSWHVLLIIGNEDWTLDTGYTDEVGFLTQMGGGLQLYRDRDQ